jgi:hypothetical protein
VSVITGLFYDFQENKVTHRANKKILRVSHEAALKPVGNEKK